VEPWPNWVLAVNVIELFDYSLVRNRMEKSDFVGFEKLF